MNILNAGLIQKWMKTHLPTDKCDRSHSAVSHTKTRMTETARIYIVLGIGLAAASVIFIFELLSNIIKIKVNRWLDNL